MSACTVTNVALSSQRQEISSTEHYSACGSKSDSDGNKPNWINGDRAGFHSVTPHFAASSKINLFLQNTLSQKNPNLLCQQGVTNTNWRHRWQPFKNLASFWVTSREQEIFTRPLTMRSKLPMHSLRYQKLLNIGSLQQEFVIQRDNFTIGTDKEVQTMRCDSGSKGSGCCRVEVCRAVQWTPTVRKREKK